MLENKASLSQHTVASDLGRQRGLLAILDERVNVSALGADGLRIRTTCFKVQEILLVPSLAGSCRRSLRLSAFAPEPFGAAASAHNRQAAHSAGVVHPMHLRLREFNSSGDEGSRKPRDVLLPAAEDAAVGLDFSVRIKRSLAILPRAVCAAVLVKRDFCSPSFAAVSRRT